MTENDLRRIAQSDSRRLSTTARQRHLMALSALARGEQCSTGGSRIPRPARAALIVLTSAVTIGAAGVGVAAAFGAFAEPTIRTLGHCYATVDLDEAAGNRTNFTLGSPGESTKPADTAAVAVEVCQQTWREGRLHTSQPYVTEPDQEGSHPVPHLVACVLTTGEVGIFPGDGETCFQLGLPTADL